MASELMRFSRVGDVLNARRFDRGAWYEHTSIKINHSTHQSFGSVVSAYPTAGALYTASAQLVPPERRAIVGWIVGWLNMYEAMRSSRLECLLMFFVTGLVKLLELLPPNLG